MNEQEFNAKVVAHLTDSDRILIAPRLIKDHDIPDEWIDRFLGLRPATTTKEETP